MHLDDFSIDVNVFAPFHRLAKTKIKSKQNSNQKTIHFTNIWKFDHFNGIFKVICLWFNYVLCMFGWVSGYGSCSLVFTLYYTKVFSRCIFLAYWPEKEAKNCSDIMQWLKKKSHGRAIFKHSLRFPSHW